MINMNVVFDRVVTWNSLRYAREYNHKLSVNLLREELQEYFDAGPDVDRLDALCDIVYVALGIIWKLDVPDEVLVVNEVKAHNAACGILDSTDEFGPIEFAAALLSRFTTAPDTPSRINDIQMLITLCFAQAGYNGLSSDLFAEALLVVCDSNDSKSIKKTDSHVKANAGDKGAYFVPPEPRLQAIIDRAYHGH